MFGYRLLALPDDRVDVDRIHRISFVIPFLNGFRTKKKNTFLLTPGFSYLLWAGTTTNETFKWSDWKEDIAADEVWMARDPARNPYTGRWPSSGPLNAYNWPVQTDKLVYRIVNPEEMEYLDKHLVWNKVESIHELENIYDIGFWKTLEGVVWDLKF